ncbi:unnamed protein product [Mytilus coruscus]|uniref:Uncharacterized protein n=1 Tax=Mytilus coruscus TaxID=42192 RepID=A0A6J8E1R2_MYTCO|nr:unnamed protein product [Mytilus coruscus]
MGCCSRASGWSKIGLLCVVCAFGLQTAGYVTNNWMVYNTVLDLNDLRVGLWWFTNCSADISCFSVLTPSSYKSLTFTLTLGFEGGCAGLLLVAMIMYCCYVAADCSRRRGMAAAIIIFLALAVCSSAAGLVLWILQIDFPYYVAWSAGLSVVATAFALMAMLCLVPDLKEYPYEKLHKRGPTDSKRPLEKQTVYTKHGSDKKKGSSLGTDYTQRNSYADVKSSRDFGYDYGARDPYAKNKNFLENDDRFSLHVVTPSRPPRADFFTSKGMHKY